MNSENLPSDELEGPEESGSPQDENLFLSSYIEHLKTLRTWLVGYGIGAPVLLLSQQHVWEKFTQSGSARFTVKLFLAGVLTQVVLTFFNKTAMWAVAFGERETDYKKTRRYKVAHWFSRLYLIDFVADIASIFLFSWATWLAFNVLVAKP